MLWVSARWGMDLRCTSRTADRTGGPVGNAKCTEAEGPQRLLPGGLPVATCTGKLRLINGALGTLAATSSRLCYLGTRNFASALWSCGPHQWRELPQRDVPGLLPADVDWRLSTIQEVCTADHVRP